MITLTGTVIVKLKMGQKYANGQLQKETVGRGHLLNRTRGKVSEKKGKPRKCRMGKVLRVRAI